MRKLAWSLENTNELGKFAYRHNFCLIMISFSHLPTVHELIHMKQTQVVAEKSVPGMLSQKNASRAQNGSKRKFCGGMF